MVIRNPDDGPKIPSREITPPETYFNRRTFLRGAALVGGVAATAGLYRYFTGAGRPPIPLITEKLALGVPAAAATSAPAPAVPMTKAQRIAAGYFVDEPQTPLEDIASYNNYYEFGIDKRGVAPLAKNFVIKPYTLAVDGLVNKPRTFDLDDLKKVAPIEERVYRHRCVEGWSMVIPWLGFPLGALLAGVDPKSSAKYVAFQTFYDAKLMPKAEYLPWPYVEGLRLDEAMHPLALLAFGLYGQVLLPQNGAPLRLVVPWKYGFKSVKAIVRLTLVDKQPPTSWNTDQPHRYGFYSNVNPKFGPQSTETRLPGGENRATQLFNGYGAQVARLYAGMDLNEYF